MRTYTAIFEKQNDGGYVVRVPALAGCHTQGDTYEEALANVREAIQLVIECLQESGEPLPEDIAVERVAVAA